jgi:hypothetical protein
VFCMGGLAWTYSEWVLDTLASLPRWLRPGSSVAQFGRSSRNATVDERRRVQYASEVSGAKLSATRESMIGRSPEEEAWLGTRPFIF